MPTTQSKKHAAKLKGTKTIVGIRIKKEIILLLITFSLSGTNIAPNIAADKIEATSQHSTPIYNKIWMNILKYNIPQLKSNCSYSAISGLANGCETFGSFLLATCSPTLPAA